ncbi:MULTISPECIES: hypothetical protein [Auritidibacter]|uniref:Uncharacterized protein n=1 Tax=Auritidibacter ignavus TaxID=678932 RepID=A0AAJ6ANM8_9MICC|nr:MULTISPECIES: hypothetical protein [Auritidibacter]PXA76119.1 hypothetical protein DCC26_09660 [Auritidibacter sp. NML120779]AXR73175.1 hypothetical protein DCC27_001340 [Auritidibacter sp. NML130574]NIH71630.1 hypothetical protein [Auritidibacter ignavus]PXA77453.1 hypothetical protein DCC24_03860 [Auritidibacter sp. NML100628]PXA81930.1 hypothetical protein DCC25_00670 [Auritidibacter sp. NML120636]
MTARKISGLSITNLPQFHAHLVFEISKKFVPAHGASLFLLTSFVAIITIFLSAPLTAFDDV